MFVVFAFCTLLINSMCVGLILHTVTSFRALVQFFGPLCSASHASVISIFPLIGRALPVSA